MTLKAHAHDNARRSQNVVGRKIRCSFLFEKGEEIRCCRRCSTVNVLVNGHILGTVQMYPTLECTVQTTIIYASQSLRAFLTWK